MPKFKLELSVLILILLLVSCASSVKQPTTIQVQTWKVQTIDTAYPDGIVSEMLRNQYDENGNLLKEEQFNSSKILVVQKLYAYTGNDTVEITTLNGTGEPLGKAVREFSSARLVRENLFTPKGVLQSTEEYTYTPKGQKTRWTVKTSTGSQISSEYTWEKGKIVRVSVLDSSGNSIKRFDRSYSPDGLLSKEVESDSAGIPIRMIVYFYDGTLLSREEIQSPSGAVVSGIQYLYDSVGNPIKIRYLDRSGNLFEEKTQTWQVFTRTVQQ